MTHIFCKIIGYDCRITAFSHMGDAISIADTENPNVANLFMDQQALQEDASAMLSGAGLPRILALFPASKAQTQTTPHAMRRWCAKREPSAASLLTKHFP